MIISPDRLSQFPIFSNLPDNLLRQTAAFCVFRAFHKGSVLFLQGQVPRYFYLVEKGSIQVYLDTFEGREYILHLVEQGQSFAEAAVLSMDRYPASARALTDCDTIAVSRQEILQLIETDGEAAKSIIIGQSLWLRRLVSITSLLTLDNIAARLARYIIEYAQSRQIHLRDGTLLDLGMRKTTLASRIGTIPATLSRNFAKVEKQGAILRQGKSIKIIDYELLKNIAFPEL